MISKGELEQDFVLGFICSQSEPKMVVLHGGKSGEAAGLVLGDIAGSGNLLCHVARGRPVQSQLSRHLSSTLSLRDSRVHLCLDMLYRH